MFEIEFEGQVVTVDPESLVREEWGQVALELGAFAMHAGVDPDDEVKAAAVALIVLRRRPQFAAVPFSAFVTAPPVETRRSLVEDLPLEQQLDLLQRMAG